MTHIKRNKQETIEYFRQLAHMFEVRAQREYDFDALSKAEAYSLVVFELESNME